MLLWPKTSYDFWYFLDPKNRNKGAFAKAPLLQNRPFVSSQMWCLQESLEFQARNRKKKSPNPKAEKLEHLAWIYYTFNPLANWTQKGSTTPWYQLHSY